MRYSFCMTFITLFLVLGQSNALLHAQVSSPQKAQQQLALAEIRTIIIQTVGARPETVEIAISGNIATILRINSNMNETTHGGRDNEANAIAPIVAKGIAGKSEFRTLNTIRVQYIVRSASGEISKIVDTIDFRKSPSGTFEFHKT